MAITVKANVNNMTPAYNAMYYYFDSTNKNELGFRYVVDVYKKTGSLTQELIKRVKISPRPGDGYGEIDISKTLQSYISHQLPSDNNGIKAANSYLDYNLEIGEETLINWEYDAFEQYQATGVFYNKLILTTTPYVGGGSGATHSYQTGDQVVIEPSVNNGFTQAFTGLFTVISAPNPTTIVLSADYQDVPGYPDGLMPGIVTYSDNRKTVIPNIETISNKGAFNGSVSHFNFRSYTNGTYKPNPVNRKPLLTNMPSDFKTAFGSTILLNAYTDDNDNNYSTWLYFQNSNATVRRVNINNTHKITSLAVGPGNMPVGDWVSGPDLPIIQPDVTNYAFYLMTSALERSSITYRVEIDRACSKYDVHELVFLDRLGSLGSFYFKYKSSQSTSIKRTDNKFIVGDFLDDEWTYESTEFGTRTINTDIKAKYELKTAWLTDVESEYFQELLSSPVSYLKVNGEYWAVNIKNSSSKKKTIVNDSLIEYTVKLELSNNDMINY